MSRRSPGSEGRILQPFEFYDRLASTYHEVYADWSRSMGRQAAQLAQIIRARATGPARTVLDASCGIGTQALGLARLGYEVTGSDISQASVLRARREARRRRVVATFVVADMRRLSAVHGREFDVVMSCDNSVPHLLTDLQILSAFRQMARCMRPGGLCVVTVRDYAAERIEGVQFRPYGVVTDRGRRVILFQTWEFHGSRYTLSLYRLEESGARGPGARVLRTQYYAVSIPRLMRLMRRAGFSNVQRLDDAYFQPVLIGRRRG